MHKRRVHRLLLAAIVLQAGACRCGDDPLDELIPEVDVQPNPIDYGHRRVAFDTPMTVKILNTGTADLVVTNMSIEPAGAPYTIRNSADAGMVSTVPSGGEGPFDLVFHPPARGPFPATLVVESNDPQKGRFEVPITGVGGPPRIRVLPEAVNFDLVNEGTPATRTVEIMNSGLDTLKVSRVELDPSSAPDFMLSPGDNFGSGDVPVGSSVLVKIDMLPATSGDATGLLHIHSDADGEPDKTVPITARGNLGPQIVLVEKVTRQSDYRTDLYLNVVLDTTGTADPEGDNYVLNWRIAERPLGSQAILQETGLMAERQLYIDTVGIYRIEVTGRDDRNAVGNAVATIRAIRDLALRLTWEPRAGSVCRSAPEPERQCGKTDVDLHLVAPTGSEGDYFTGCDQTVGCDSLCRPTMSGAVCRSRGLDCSYANRNPDWTVIGSTDDDPRLDIDDAYGYGPENISMNNPVAGDYLVKVHFCNDRLSDEGSVAKVEVLFHGEPANPPILGPVDLQGEGKIWLAGIVHYDPNATPKFTLTHFNNGSPPIVDAAANLCTQ